MATSELLFSNTNIMIATNTARTYKRLTRPECTPIADAYHRPAAVPRTALTASVRSSVYQVNEVLRYGPLVGGAELAWKVALHLASCTIAANYSALDFAGQEEHCDKHHDRLDRRLSSICDLQHKCGKAYWLNAERLDEVEQLKREADAPYRYPLTTAILRPHV
ncbi:hypothetical protein BST61_g4892 [Cercospora zeina]